jgi:hypothetical protein
MGIKGVKIEFLCLYMDGSGNMLLLVTGKSEKPKCFKHVKYLLYTYTYKCSSWVPGVPEMFGEENSTKY